MSVGPTCQPPVSTRGNSVIGLPVVWTIRRVLRTRYAAPIGIVDTSGGLAGLVLPLTNILCIGIPVMLWHFSELRFSTKESDKVTNFVIEAFYAASGNL